jgi:hypothetical protein
MSVVEEQLRLLFESELPDPHLVIERGQPKVAAAPEDTEDVLDVASRADLLAQYGGSPPSGAALTELAARLGATIDALGA